MDGLRSALADYMRSSYIKCLRFLVPWPSSPRSFLALQWLFRNPGAAQPLHHTAIFSALVSCMPAPRPSTRFLEALARGSIEQLSDYARDGRRTAVEGIRNILPAERYPVSARRNIVFRTIWSSGPGPGIEALRSRVQYSPLLDWRQSRTSFIGESRRSDRLLLRALLSIRNPAPADGRGRTSGATPDPPPSQARFPIHSARVRESSPSR